MFVRSRRLVRFADSAASSWEPPQVRFANRPAPRGWRSRPPELDAEQLIAHAHVLAGAINAIYYLLLLIIF
jgi:hypothetical protein